MKKARYLSVCVLALMAVSFIAGHYFRQSSGIASASTHRVLYWIDPMHPAYKSDKPGIAPDCGMQLEPVYADGTNAPGTDAASIPGAVHITTEQQQLIGVRVAEVTHAAGSRNVRVSGRVAADEERTYKIFSGTDGFIEKTFQDTTGTRVTKDQLLATFSGPEFVTAQQAYLANAVRSPDSYREVRSENDWRGQTNKLNIAKLRSMGMSDAQIKRITEKGQSSETIDILSPTDGFIIARAVSPGQRFDKGAELYRIADLTHVWILADVFENEAAYFRPGTMATVTAPQSGKKFRARVTNVLPQFDPATRTLKARLEADNPHFELRPDMFVDIELPTQVPPGLSVPADAVLDSGLKKRVFVDRGNGFFEPREVETGWRTGDRVQITRGLQSGDRVVVSGTFLLDSESRLKSTASSATSPEMTAPAAKPVMKMDKAEHNAATASKTAKDPSCGMDVTIADAAAAGKTTTYRGKTYYFCSASCKSNFEKDPEKYLASGHDGMQHD